MRKRIKKDIEADSIESIANKIKNDLKEDVDLPKADIKELRCRVCGFEYDEENAPWQKIDGQWFASYEICVCCNVHFGYEDVEKGAVKTFRNNWLLNGAKFFYKNAMPKNWSLEKQLENVGENWKDMDD